MQPIQSTDRGKVTLKTEARLVVPMVGSVGQTHYIYPWERHHVWQ